MFLSGILFCLFTVVMAENKLTSVDFEIFGNVQGKSNVIYSTFHNVCDEDTFIHLSLFSPS